MLRMLLNEEASCALPVGKEYLKRKEYNVVFQFISLLQNDFRMSSKYVDECYHFVSGSLCWTLSRL